MFTSVKWIRISLINLSLVAILGVVMRYKIAFEFPFLDQKNIQHAHSHFAFYGWITHTLLFLLVDYLQKKSDEFNIKKYSILIITNLLSAYGMLISFSLGGYNKYSIFFSLTAIVVSYLFTIWFIKDLRKLNWTSTSMYWFTAALIFNVIASLGTFSLGYMMATKHLTQHLYLASVYFYLHFQYNGWFFFAIMGLLSLFLGTTLSSFKNDKRVFWMFALSCVPAYFLSTLWLKLPMWLYIIVIIAACVQFVAWIIFLRHINKFYAEVKSSMSQLLFYFLMLILIAITIKIGLQLASVVPHVSTLAFGFRPIVIAYLHLVLLAIISIFLISYFLSNRLIKLTRISKIGTVLLTIGVYATEVILAIQGIASFTYTLVPHTNEALLIMAVVILTGIFLLAFSFRKYN